MEKEKQQILIKTSIIWESMIELEEQMGLIMRDEILIKEITKRARRYKIKFGNKEIEEIMHYLLGEGFILSPKGGYHVRAEGWARFQKLSKNL